MGRLNSMYGSIGSMATKLLHGPQARSTIKSVGGFAAFNKAGGNLAAIDLARNVKTGKKVIGGAVGMGLLARANKKHPVGGYNPRRPVMPVPQNGRRM
jgi:hypothetical protein